MIKALWLRQVRNLRGCIKVAIDFVSPESVAPCLELTHERRLLTLAENAVENAEGAQAGNPDYAGADLAERRHCDKLQAELMLARAARDCLARLRA